MNYSETELSDLIKSVEAEFSAHLTLAKSEGFPPKKEEESKEEPKEKEEGEEKHEEKEESADEGHEAPESDGEEKDEEPSEDKPEFEQEEGEKEEGPSDQKPEGDDGHDYDEDDMNQMHEMYSSMKGGELKAHHDCIKKCLDGKKEGAMMAKSEQTEVVAPIIDLEQITMLKSEVEAEKAKATELKKSLDMVTEILTKFVSKTAPAAKAVTDLQVIEKSETPVKGIDLSKLTKQDITAKLNAAASRSDLAKSDREAINAFYLGTTPNIESISHLLK